VLQLEDLRFGIFPAMRFKLVEGTYLPRTARALNLGPSLLSQLGGHLNPLQPEH
jgi:hypothetical protein